MAASYPAAIKTWTPRTDTVDDVMATDVNTLYEEVTAVQTELGADVAGTAATLLARLAKAISPAGPIQYAAATTLTIAAGSITVTQNYHRIDTESAAATDNLDTITTAAEGWQLILTTVADGRDVTIRSGVGNILCAAGKDITLGTAADMCILIYDGVASKWIAMGVTAAALTNVPNTWTAQQTFSAGFATAITAITTTTTLDATYQVITCNATGGAITVNLPAAAGCTGRRYDVIKTDASANAVTLDGNGAETINGAATYALSNQWSAVTVISTGSAWLII